MFGKHIFRTLRKIAMPVSIALAIFVAGWSGITGDFDSRLSDLRFQATERPPTGQLVLVDIDPKSLAEIGVWPWPRSLHGELIRAAGRLGAAQIAFDVDFSTHSTAEADEAFADALSQSSAGTVLAAFVQPDTAGSRTIRASMPIDMLLQHSWPAMVNVPVDRDGKVRRFPFSMVGTELLASMPSVLAARDEAEGLFGMDFSIAAAQLARVSYVDLLNNRVNPDVIRGKNLIVGASAIELHDLFPVPVHGVVSGSTIIALATETLLQNRELAYVEVPLILLVAICLLAVLGLSRLRSLHAMLSLGGLALAIEGLALHMQSNRGIVFETANLQIALAGFLLWAAIREFDLRRILLWVARTEVKNRESILERVVEDGFDGIVLIDEQNRVIRSNQAAGVMLGVERLRCLDDLPSQIAQNVDNIRRSFQNGNAAHREPLQQAIANAQGEVRIVEYTVAPFKLTAISAAADEESCDAIFVCLLISDVTERERAQQNMRFMALHDSLTGLHNRHALEQRLTEALSEPDAGAGTALLYFDLDRFKVVNDALGHGVGDKVLIETAGRARLVLGISAFIARLGGDEFCAVISADTHEAADAQARALVRAIEEPMQVDGHRISIQMSIGIGHWTTSSGTASALMRHADVALYRAKRPDTNRIVHFEPFMEEDRLARLEIEQDLASALQNCEFQVFYQPQVALDTGKIIGVEALLRWKHPTKGMIPPNTFIPVAEEMGLIHELGSWVLATACRDAAGCPGAIKLAVNVSSIQLAAGDLVGAVRQALDISGFPAARLELEITESVFVEESDRIREIFDRLLDIGVRFALDDFGTGYSSLGYLNRLPISKVKIDQAFVRGLPGDRHAMAILRSVQVLASNLEISTIAEGVETLQQAEILQQLGYDEGQGYLFSKPIDVSALELLLQERRNWPIVSARSAA